MPCLENVTAQNLLLCFNVHLKLLNLELDRDKRPQEEFSSGGGEDWAVSRRT